MLKSVSTVVFLLAINTACAATPSTDECDYASPIIKDLNLHIDGKLVKTETGLDPDSHEHTLKHAYTLSNGDKFLVEQKYCTMYNLTVTYDLAALSKAGFEHSLSTIEQVTKQVKQDYELKAPLKDLVNMVMNQNQASIKTEFDLGLPVQVVRSSTSIEHSIQFNPNSSLSGEEAEIVFYVGLGGE